MKRALSKVGRAFGAFFSSLWGDIKEAVKKHWMAILGRIVMVLVPIGFIIYAYLKKAPSRWGLPIFVWIPIIVFALVYWTKLRTYLAIKVSAMKVENSINRGKHGAAIALCDLLMGIMAVVPFWLGWRVCKALESVSISMASVFQFMMICAIVGVSLIVMDDLKTRLVIEDEEFEEYEENKQN